MGDYTTTAICLYNKSNNYNNKQVRNYNSYKEYWSQTSNINENNIVWKIFNAHTRGKVRWNTEANIHKLLRTLKQHKTSWGRLELAIGRIGLEHLI